MIIKKKIIIILLLVLFCFSLTAHAIDYFDDLDGAAAEAEKQLEEGNIDEALILYNLAFILTENEEYKEKISELRRHEGLINEYHSIGINLENMIFGEARKLQSSEENEYGLHDYNAYKLFIINGSEEDLELNFFMTDITMITDQGRQVSPMSPMDFMELDVPIDKISKIQGAMPANQKIYPDAVQDFLLIFREDFTPNKLIIDGILGEAFEDYRVDIEFIGL